MALKEKKTVPILILLCIGLCLLLSACDGASTKYGEALRSCTNRLKPLE